MRDSELNSHLKRGKLELYQKYLVQSAEFGNVASMNEVSINYQLGIQGFPKVHAKVMFYRHMAVSAGSDLAKILLISDLIETNYLRRDQLSFHLKSLEMVKDPAYGDDVRRLWSIVEGHKQKTENDRQQKETPQRNVEEPKKMAKEKEDEVLKRDLKAKADMRRKMAEAPMSARRK